MATTTNLTWPLPIGKGLTRSILHLAKGQGVLSVISSVGGGGGEVCWQSVGIVLAFVTLKYEFNIILVKRGPKIAHTKDLVSQWPSPRMVATKPFMYLPHNIGGLGSIQTLEVRPQEPSFVQDAFNNNVVGRPSSEFVNLIFISW